MHGLPADAREDHVWMKKTGTRKQFSLHMLSKVADIFEHHQIELVSAPPPPLLTFFNLLNIQHSGSARRAQTCHTTYRSHSFNIAFTYGLC